MVEKRRVWSSFKDDSERGESDRVVVTVKPDSLVIIDNNDVIHLREFGLLCEKEGYAVNAFRAGILPGYVIGGAKGFEVLERAQLHKDFNGIDVEWDLPVGTNIGLPNTSKTNKS